MESTQSQQRVHMKDWRIGKCETKFPWTLCGLLIESLYSLHDNVRECKVLYYTHTYVHCNLLQVVPTVSLHQKYTLYNLNVNKSN